MKGNSPRGKFVRVLTEAFVPHGAVFWYSAYQGRSLGHRKSTAAVRFSAVLSKCEEGKPRSGMDAEEIGNIADTPVAATNLRRIVVIIVAIF